MYLELTHVSVRLRGEGHFSHRRRLIICITNTFSIYLSVSVCRPCAPSENCFLPTLLPSLICSFVIAVTVRHLRSGLLLFFCASSETTNINFMTKQKNLRLHRVLKTKPECLSAVHRSASEPQHRKTNERQEGAAA